MKKAYERLIEYASVYSPSDENFPVCPSTPCQTEFGKLLVKEMLDLGISDARIDEHGYVYGSIPANTPSKVSVGFIAHMDVISDVPSADPKLRIIKNYDGGDILLNEEKNIVLSPSEFSSLKTYVGKDLLVTDGTTILGADDKAGVAEILTMAEYLLAHPEVPHGRIGIAFTPDEEIGRGADLFNVEGFGCDFAYTADGASFGEINYETFNAYSAKVTVKGFGIHPGSAKDKMINSMDAANEFHSILPAAMKPRYTEGYEGFIHLTSISGTVEETVMDYIVRDHDTEKLQKKLDIMRRAADAVNECYGTDVVSIDFSESYLNMACEVEKHSHLIENAKKAVEALGGTPITTPIRGGTDGARLSFMGLPCPNLGTGSHNHHGRFEYACCEDMELASMALVELAKIYAKF